MDFLTRARLGETGEEMERGGVFFLGPGKRITQLAPHSRELREAEGRKGKEKTERVIFCVRSRGKRIVLSV